MGTEANIDKTHATFFGDFRFKFDERTSLRLIRTKLSRIWIIICATIYDEIVRFFALYKGINRTDLH